MRNIRIFITKFISHENARNANNPVVLVLFCGHVSRESRDVTQPLAGPGYCTALELQTKVREDFTITEKAPTGAKQALTHSANIS